MLHKKGQNNWKMLISVKSDMG